ncbi:hypothetical protein ACM66B_005926 [Microbotryomycetes sp. NB124-2]
MDASNSIEWSQWPGYGPNCASWHLEQATSSTRDEWHFVRPLGILEHKFDDAARKQGMSDTFIRLSVSVESVSSPRLFETLPRAWAELRQRRPVLACTIQDTECSRDDNTKSGWTGFPGVKGRELRSRVCKDDQELWRSALETLDVREAEESPVEIADEIQAKEILNGPRTLLDQARILARIVVVRDTSQSRTHSHQLFLVIAHAISDGLSLLSTVRELFDLLAAPGDSQLVISRQEFLRRLPPSTESQYLPLPLRHATSSDQPEVPRLEGLDAAGTRKHVQALRQPASVARQRWVWAISRLRTMKRQRDCPAPALLPRRLPEPDVQAHTEWKQLRLDRQLSGNVMRLCKLEKISPSMLLYSLLSIVLSNILSRLPDGCSLRPIVLGFPCSSRPFLDPARPETTTDLAIRITFGQIVLPCDVVKVGPGRTEFRRKAISRARLAKQQFQQRFAVEDRAFFLADTYMRTLDRVLSSAGNNPIPLQEPKTTFNASMIGDVDRILPTCFPLDSTASVALSVTLSDLSIGTRLHYGEGMLCETWTFDGQLTVAIGFDKAIVEHSLVERDQVAQHNSKDDLWMIINGKVYDLTSFAPNHPGGIKVLLKYAGKDATEEYDPIHPPGTIEEALSPAQHLGPVDMGTVAKVVVEEQKAPAGPPVSLASCVNIADIEAAGENLLKPKAFAYYASAADDERTKNWNHDSFAKVRFRPRVLRDVTNADLSRTILGFKSSLPFFIAPAAMGRLAHPDGEKNFARVAAARGFPYLVSANSSVGFEELAQVAGPNAHLIYQLYVNRDRPKTEAILKRVAAAGYKAICVTVDAPVAGKRERDERSKMDAESAADDSMRDAVPRSSPDKPQGIAQNLGSYVDASLSFSDLPWIKQHSNNLPLIVKGVQSVEDAVLCAKSNQVSGIYLSNHGGRQLEGAPSSLETLLEIRKYEPWVFDKCQVFLDGGIKRGTDVLKALALGATAVGVGRPFMYSLVFGQQGVDKATEILAEEVAQNLRLLGCTSLEELSDELCNTTALENELVDGSVYEKSKRKDLSKSGWIGWIRSKL